MSNSVARKIIHGAPARSNGQGEAGLYAADGGRKYLNQAERRRVLTAMVSLRTDKALFALTLAWTGARVSEVLALSAASFQIEDGIVAITTLKRRRHSVREVPLPLELIEALERHFHLSELQLDPILRSRRLWPWCRATAWRLIKSIMADANVAGRPACPRGLRHGFGVGTLQKGVPLNLVQRWLGHARISTTAIYANASGPEEREFAERFWQAAESTAARNPE